MNCVEVWSIDLAPVSALERHLDALLDDEERERARRFVRPSDALGFRVSHAALRTILGRRVGLAPGRVRFSRGPYGKPALAGGGPGFNLSHTGGLALVAVADQGEVGVDVEALRGVPDARLLAARYLSAQQAEEIARLCPSRRARAFLAAWTAMEALLKAQGTGLGRERPPSDPAWSVHPLVLGRRHVGAVAAVRDEFALHLRRFAF